MMKAGLQAACHVSHTAYRGSQSWTSTKKKNTYQRMRTLQPSLGLFPSLALSDDLEVVDHVKERQFWLEEFMQGSKSYEVVCSCTSYWTQLFRRRKIENGSVKASTLLSNLGGQPALPQIGLQVFFCPYKSAGEDRCCCLQTRATEFK